MKIPLVPIAILGVGRGGLQCGCDILDVVPSDRDEPHNPFRPERGDDTGGTAAPIIAHEYRSSEAEPVHQAQEIAPERRLLPGSWSRRIAESRRAVAPQIRNDDA